MYVSGGTDTNIWFGSGSCSKYIMNWMKNMWRDHLWVDLTQLELFVVNLGSMTYVAFLGLGGG